MRRSPRTTRRVAARAAVTAALSLALVGATAGTAAAAPITKKCCGPYGNVLLCHSIYSNFIDPTTDADTYACVEEGNGWYIYLTWFT